MLLNFNHFEVGTQTPGTKVHSASLTAEIQRHRVDVRLPHASGMSLGMAYIMAELWLFAT